MPLTCVFKCFAVKKTGVKKKQGKAAYGVSPTLLPLHSERLGEGALRLAKRESTLFFSHSWNRLRIQARFPSAAWPRFSAL